MSEQIVLEGYIAITAALEAGRRPIHQIYIHDRKRYDQRLKPIRELVTSQKIPFEFVPQSTIDEYTQGSRHGGVLALAGTREYQALAELLPDDSTPCIMMFDGIEDPYNLGFAVRATYAAGVDGVVLPQREWNEGESVVMRSSAGAWDRMPLALTDDLRGVIDYYRQRGLVIATTAQASDAKQLYDANLTQPLFILVGGERRGISRSVLQTGDLMLEIPYGRPFDYALGAVSAVTVIAFEVNRQRLR